ncbi:MAG: PfkB family carbohydrate kinase [Acidobacteria bacterium]|nr:PfkB family carbohydrate kinase [Acidobacteriota bacterium]MCA1608813.1 PfkB family carbohydrate kinase [Acidobacteriota bacterium]
MSSLSEIVRKTFPAKKILIVGDLVADQFLHGTISRVSREAPVFILNHDRTDTAAGGAANAAANVASLCGRPILIGLIGDDEDGKLLVDALRKANVRTENIIVDDNLRTTTKVRVLAGQHYAARQQVIRIDYANGVKINEESRQSLIENFASTAKNADAIIVSDYNYGVVDEELFTVARSLARERKIPLLVDSRFRLTEFTGATTATPNLDEVEGFLGKNFTAADCSNLCERLNYEALLVTCGNKGMQLFVGSKTAIRLEAVGPIEPIDVTGAGDTVIAVYALGLASGLSFADAAAIANHAGGLVVMKKGTASVTVAELCESLDRSSALSFSETAR